MKATISKTAIAPAIRRLARDMEHALPQAEMYLVGGVVRDLLLGREIKDYDLVVRGVPVARLTRELRRHGTVNLVGRAFGVLKVTLKHAKQLGEIDVALPRTEHALRGSGAYRDFAVQSDHRLPLADDVSRRDFTINALAYRLTTGELIDSVGGVADLKKKTIRTVGAPAARFAEDYSRLLRAVRLSVQLGFTVESKTAAAVRRLASRLNRRVGGEYVVPRETVAKEVVKTLRAHPVHGLQTLDQFGFMKLLLPELLKMKGCAQPRNHHSEGDVWTHTLLCLQNLSSARFRRQFGAALPSSNLLWATLCHDLGKPYTITLPARGSGDRIRFHNHDTVGAARWQAICERLRLSSATDGGDHVDCATVAWLIRHHMLVTNGAARDMKHTTLEKYFFSDAPGDDLQRLIFVDAISTIPPSGRPQADNFQLLQRRLRALTRSRGQRPTLPPPLLDGNAIMRLTRLPPGPRIGELLTALREEQLAGRVTTKRAAQQFIGSLI